MKILVLDATTKVLKADLAANPTTNPDYVISYADVDSSTFTEGSADGALTGTTSATLLTGLGSGSKRIVKSISIHNRDSNTITVYLKLDNNGTVRIIEKIVLAAGEAWHNDTQAGSGSARPGGSDTQVQFNDGSAFGGDSDLTYNKTTNTLTGVNINATTLDTTNLEVTNIKAKDGVSAVSIADSTGIVTVSTQLQVDNINVSTNTISSTDANGNIILAPNGTGTVKETVSSTNYNIVSQADIGTAPNKIPLNQYLGSMAYQDGDTSDITVYGVRVGRGASAVSTNTALGAGALEINTTGANNVVLGYQAGYSNTTGGSNLFVGWRTGYNNTSGSFNTYVGPRTASYSCARLMTTGSKNTILGGFNGNQGGLDIRTSSANIVLSDGDGNPYAYYVSGGWSFGNSTIPLTGTSRFSGTVDNLLTLTKTSGTNWKYIDFYQGASRHAYMGVDSSANISIYADSAGGQRIYMIPYTNGVYLASGATSWSSASDARLKNITGDIEDAVGIISSISAKRFTWKDDSSNKPQVGLIAQTVEPVLPEVIEYSKKSVPSGQQETDSTEYMSVRYAELVPVLVKAIQELKSELDTVKAELATLKGA